MILEHVSVYVYCLFVVFFFWSFPEGKCVLVMFVSTYSGHCHRDMW